MPQYMGICFISSRSKDLIKPATHMHGNKRRVRSKIQHQPLLSSPSFFVHDLFSNPPFWQFTQFLWFNYYSKLVIDFCFWAVFQNVLDGPWLRLDDYRAIAYPYQIHLLNIFSLPDFLDAWMIFTGPNLSVLIGSRFLWKDLDFLDSVRYMYPLFPPVPPLFILNIV